MLIGGIQKISFIDFPGKISCVVFTQGCNFRCPFCHNPTLVDPSQFQKPIPEEEVFKFLLSREKFLDGVVISGGEPTLHKDLRNFIEKIKANLKNFLIKLDTNGNRPDVIIDLVKDNLIDFVAMDIKHVFGKYQNACGISPRIDEIKRSIQFLIECGIGYEFRTTIVPGIHTVSDIKMIAEQLHGAKKFAIQQFVPDHALDTKLRKQELESIFGIKNQEILSNIKTECLKHVKTFEIRAANSAN